MGIIKNATFFTIMLHFLLSVIIIGGISKYFIVKVKKFNKFNKKGIPKKGISDFTSDMPISFHLFPLIGLSIYFFAHPLQNTFLIGRKYLLLMELIKNLTD